MFFVFLNIIPLNGYVVVIFAWNFLFLKLIHEGLSSMGSQ